MLRVAPELVPTWDILRLEAVVLDTELEWCWGVPPLRGSLTGISGKTRGFPDVSEITFITASLMEAMSSSSRVPLCDITAEMLSRNSEGF